MDDNDVSFDFQPDEAYARQLDSEDPLAGYRDRFCIPSAPDGSTVIYLAGHSLGLQPMSILTALERELRAWADRGVDGHFIGATPWYTYHETLRETGAKIVGAQPGEVVMMNSLTVNLHLMMVTFYRPTPERYKILMEQAAFPSDTYAVTTQLRYHGIDPAEGLLLARPRAGEHTIRTEDIEALIGKHGGQIALVMMGGVHYYTGQVYDMERITTAAKRQGCMVGFDLAHAAGNIALKLHEWQVDFAVWCTYKYLNSGPGAVAGCFVHEVHGKNLDLPRWGGWWGHDPATRFRMHLQPAFRPQRGAAGWQISNPPILAMAPVKASLELFDEVGVPALREKSQRLTGYLQYMIDTIEAEHFEVITPREGNRRGCQLSILVHDRPRELLDSFKAKGVICDYREPNVIRVAPVPFYNTYHEVWRFARILASHDRHGR